MEQNIVWFLVFFRIQSVQVFKFLDAGKFDCGSRRTIRSQPNHTQGSNLSQGTTAATFTATDNRPESFFKNSTAPKELQLKIGAQVVLIKNLGANLVNGNRGVVHSFSEKGWPTVIFDNGMQKELRPVKWTSGMRPNVFREQIPLKFR